MDETQLKNLRLLTLGDANNTDSDAVLKVLCVKCKQQLDWLATIYERRYGLPETKTLDPELEWLIDDMTVRAFNRLGSEGYESESVEGHSIKFRDLLDNYEDLFRLHYGEKADEKSGEIKYGWVKGYL